MSDGVKARSGIVLGSQGSILNPLLWDIVIFPKRTGRKSTAVSYWVRKGRFWVRSCGTLASIGCSTGLICVEILIGRRLLLRRYADYGSRKGRPFGVNIDRGCSGNCRDENNETRLRSGPPQFRGRVYSHSSGAVPAVRRSSSKGSQWLSSRNSTNWDFGQQVAFRQPFGSFVSEAARGNGRLGKILPVHLGETRRRRTRGAHLCGTVGTVLVGVARWGLVGSRFFFSPF
uniref:Uncharacterized protein n=1 Tax=Bombyx mori TaxID=7091 RepID=A0A8R2LX35_BOMMO|nr:uncharacterized protein LOC119628749 [Bombyx mori]